ncbi:MAG TPA: hypothetical protein VGQ57_21425 [Polyangiaceae bacterium]|nr:hypothetical protein [Polyangiaceae bacterium]
MRGDAGALPKLTIELTDDGYRAIDPALKVRYVVSEAPAGTPVTDGARTVLSTVPPPVVEVLSPATGVAPSAAVPVAPSPEPPAHAPAPPAPTAVAWPAPAIPASRPVESATVSEPSAPPAASALAVVAPAAEPAASAPPATSSAPPPPPLPSTQVIRQREERATDANPIAYRELALAVKMGVSRPEVEALLHAKLEELRASLPEETRRYVQLAVFDHVFVKRPVRPPLGTLQWKDWRGEPLLAFPGFGEGSEAPPPSSISSSRLPSWSPGIATSVPPFGSTGTMPPLASSPNLPAGHGPSAVPHNARTPPYGTGAQSSPSAEPPRASVIPARVVSVGPSSPAPAPSVSAAPAPVITEPVPPAPQVVEPRPAVLPAAAALDEAPIALTQVRAHLDVDVDIEVTEEQPEAAAAPPSEPPVAAASEPPSEPPVAAASEPPSETLVAAASEPPVAPASEPPVARRSEPARGRRSDPSLGRRSDPAPGRRRAPGEDLIGDLFERMHELAFMPDIVSGADFVVRVLAELIPCEAMLVHVFDLGRRDFVVVRARGPHPANALMFRTPDTDPFIIEVMRRPSMISNGAAPKHSRAFGPLGVEPNQIMVRGARHGGRYLGMIELGNPLGGSPFHDGEVNALEYVCEQFADFVASRPVVLDEDVVRG